MNESTNLRHCFMGEIATFSTVLDVFVQLFAKTKQGETLGKESRLVSGIE